MWKSIRPKPLVIQWHLADIFTAITIKCWQTQVTPFHYPVPLVSLPEKEKNELHKQTI